MKKIIYVLVILSAVISAVIGYNSKNSENYENSLTLDMYFFDETSSTLVAEEREIGYRHEEDIIKNTVDAIIRGPQNSKNKRILKKETELNSAIKEGTRVYLDFTIDFLSDDKTKDTMAAYAIVKTLCQLNEVSEVEISINEEQLIGADGNAVGFLSGEDIKLEKDSTEEKYVLLYFLNPETGKLQTEAREIKMTDPQPIEQYIVNELIKGPQSEGLKGVLSPDTTVISAQTTDGTCFLNFSSNFVTKNAGEKEEEAIQSIVLSLTELEEVRSVQFLVDGKKISEFGDMTINKSISRSKKMIEE